MVIATGEMGELGIAPRHAPLITRLKPGHVRVILPGGEEHLAAAHPASNEARQQRLNDVKLGRHFSHWWASR